MLQIRKHGGINFLAALTLFLTNRDFSDLSKNKCFIVSISTTFEIKRSHWQFFIMVCPRLLGRLFTTGLGSILWPCVNGLTNLGNLDGPIVLPYWYIVRLRTLVTILFPPTHRIIYVCRIDDIWTLWWSYNRHLLFMFCILKRYCFLSILKL